MRIVSLTAALLSVVSMLALAACKKTGDNEYEVQKPVIGTVPETVTTPRVEMDSAKVVVPKVEVKKDTVTIKKPVIKNP